jgi:cell division protein FtsI/penicillin-binding protein 2
VQAAVVVLNPKDGRVIAMASFDTAGGTDNLCLKADFPAASVFKIVSAAAAMDSAGYTPNRPVYYVGRKHTLYKGQLKKRTNTYGAKVSFSEAFASSINSVFGKVGIYDLGKQVMTEYAERFLFNRAIPFDLPVSKSTTQIPESDFEVAEFASGFNKKTRISPLHAALLASAVVNEGHIMAPWLVRRITSESGTVLFEREPKRLASPISPAVAEGMKVLMRETVLYGTCKKTFRRLRRKKAFKHIDLGAKTGNINDSSDRFKYDWLTAYVVPSKGDQSICISVLCVHGKALGVRANRLGRLIIRYYVLS